MLIKVYIYCYRPAKSRLNKRKPMRIQMLAVIHPKGGTWLKNGDAIAVAYASADCYLPAFKSGPLWPRKIPGATQNAETLVIDAGRQRTFRRRDFDRLCVRKGPQPLPPSS